jgi:hypothetical protein
MRCGGTSQLHHRPIGWRLPHLLGRIERDLAPPSYRQKLTNWQEFLNAD